MNDDVLEVIKKLLDLGMTPERIAERLDFDLESIVCSARNHGDKHRNTPSLLL